MRLLIAVLSPGTARRIAAGMEIRGFDALIAPNGTQALKLLSRERFDLLILHACLPELDGFEVLESLAALHHPCPPRVLFLCEPELCASRPALADAVAPICAAPEKLCALLETLAQKPLPKLQRLRQPRTAQAVDTFLSAISMDRRYKGRAYAAWLLEHLAPSPVLEERSMGQLYRSCARAFGTTPTAVERCLRVAVESVFTQGSMRGIERFSAPRWTRNAASRPTGPFCCRPLNRSAGSLLGGYALAKQQRDAPQPARPHPGCRRCG